MSFRRTFGRVSPCARGRRVQRPSPTSRNRAVVGAGRIGEDARHVEQGDYTPSAPRASMGIQ